jgi:hypothetical protein
VSETIKGKLVARNPAEYVSKGFARTDFADTDVVLIVRPGTYVADVARLLHAMLDDSKLTRLVSLQKYEIAH